MARKVTVVISQGQSANPVKRKLEEDLVGALLFEQGADVTVIPHLYDLTPDGTGMLCLQGITGDMILLSWLYPRAAHWILDRHDIRGKEGKSLIVSDSDAEGDDSEDDDSEKDAAEEKPRVLDSRPLPNRTIYCLDLRAKAEVQPFLDEIRRIRTEQSVQTVDLMGWIAGTPKPEQLERYLAADENNGVPPPTTGDFAHSNGKGASNGSAAASIIPTSLALDVPTITNPPIPLRVEESTSRRWYPVIDYSRCTNCMECIDFCLFGVYGVDRVDTILVEQPDNCRKGCPACSRVCPENAIIFPQHKSPAIAGSPDGEAGGLKIDLSKLFGAPDGLEVAVLERDVELVAVGRDAVGMSVGIPKRQDAKASGPKDELDNLMDQLDDLDL
jgi:NAD-dependent dihydropyrimidine dehydrogenase PreA subunit